MKIENRGISPLIGAVIVISIVIGVGYLASEFFLGFMKSQAERSGESGEAAECFGAHFHIDEDSVKVYREKEYQLGPKEYKIKFTAINRGEVPLSNWTITTYRKGDLESVTTNKKIIPGGTYKFRVDSVKEATTLRVVSEKCSSKFVVLNLTEGNWETVIITEGGRGGL